MSVDRFDPVASLKENAVSVGTVYHSKHSRISMNSEIYL